MTQLFDSPVPQWQVDPGSGHEDPLLDCLVEIARLHGAPVTAQALSSGLPLEDNKLTPALLPRAAARARMSARVARRKLADIPAALLPAILLLKNERACLLLGVEENGDFLISHPELGGSAEAVAAADLADDYAGYVGLVRPEFRYDARAPEIVRVRGRHWFWAAVAENAHLYRDALVAALLINLFTMAMPMFTMNVYDRVVPNNAMETLWVLALGIFLVLLFNYFLSTARAYVVDNASKRIDVRLSSLIMERVLDLRMEGKPVSVGSFASNLRSFESIRDFIASASITTLVDLPFVLMFLGVMLWISPWLVLPPAVAIVLVLIVSLVAQQRMENLTLSTFQAAAQRNATLVEALSGYETVKTLNAQGIVQRNWERSTEFIAHIGGKLKLISSATVGFVQAAQQLVSVAVVIIGVYLAQDSQLSMGGIIAASMLAGRCLAPLGAVAGLLMQYQNARTSLGSIDRYMSLDVERPVDAEFLHRPVLSGAIEFRNVTFSYPGASEPVLKNVSFKLAPGEKVGIIGRIGSGKTTLEKLIMGLYQPQEGAVLFDGVDIRQIDPADLRRAVGYVPQDPVLFYGSLKYNLTMGSPHADDASVLAAADTAGVTEFANLHPQGFDMLIGERGESLSGGQRQSVAVARALINDPPVLLLDEPSSNMDHQSESNLRQRLTDASTDKTMVLITHRTALLDLVSRLIVVDRGSVVADGPKEQVVEALRQGRVGRGS
jgi:ATP-binding cassette subfamily C protein LapB